VGIHKGALKRHGKRLRLTTWLFLCHPAVSLAYFTGFFLLIFLYAHPVFIVTGFVCAGLQAAYHIGLRYFAGKIKLTFLFCLLLALLNPLLNHRGAHILFYLFQKPVTLEAAAYGAYMMFLLMTMFALFIDINQTVGTGKLLYIFSRAAPQTSFIVSMSMRYSSFLKREAADYLGVQRTRDVDASEGKSNKLKRAGVVVAGFCALTLEKGMQIAESLRAREYGKTKRTLYASYLFTGLDAVFLASCLMLCIAGTVFALTGAGSFDYFRGLSDWRLDLTDMCAYSLFIVYMLLPYVMDAYRETIRRRSLELN